MSLINQMLRDLESRNGVAAGAGGGVVEGLGSVDPQTVSEGASRRRSWPLILAAVAIVTALSGMWFAGVPELVTSRFTDPSDSDRVDIRPSRGATSPAGPLRHGRGERTAANPRPATGTRSFDMRQSNDLRAVRGPPPAQGSEPSDPAAAATRSDPGPAVKASAGPATEVPASREVVQAKPSAASNAPSRSSANAAAKVESREPVPLAKTPMPASPPDRAESAYRDAVVYLRRGRHRDAEPLLRQALEIHPTHLKAREVLAGELTRQGRLGSAAALLREGLERDPGQTQLAKLYARILLEQSQPEAALDVLQSYAPAVEADPEHHAFAAALLWRRGLHAEAAAVYRRVLVVMPRQAAWWMGLGLALEGQGERQAAMAAYQRAQHHGGFSADVQQYLEARLRSLQG